MAKKTNNKKKEPSRRLRTVPCATTAQILGGLAAKTTSATAVKRKWAKPYRKLVQLRNQLLRQKEDLSQEVNEQVPLPSMHLADSGTDSFQRDFALGLMSSHQNALYEIDEALKRIENGTYGICEITGQPIAIARLEAVPWTRFSMEAEKQLERDGNVRSAHVGDLTMVREGEHWGPEDSDEQEEKKEKD